LFVPCVILLLKMRAEQQLTVAFGSSALSSLSMQDAAYSDKKRASTAASAKIDNIDMHDKFIADDDSAHYSECLCLECMGEKPKGRWYHAAINLVVAVIGTGVLGLSVCRDYTEI
jgi:hypothetical protein